MTRRTTINLDTDLLEEARAVLGTKRISDTIHMAMREAVKKKNLQRLADWEFPPDFTLDKLEEMRRAS